MNISNARIEVTFHQRVISYYMHINFVYTRFIISKNFRIASICICDPLTVYRIRCVVSSTRVRRRYKNRKYAYVSFSRAHVSWLAIPFLFPRQICKTGVTRIVPPWHFICLMSRQPKMHYFPPLSVTLIQLETPSAKNFRRNRRDEIRMILSWVKVTWNRIPEKYHVNRYREVSQFLIIATPS